MSSTTKTLNISPTVGSGKRKKGSKSPSKVSNNKTSIVDNLLKDRKSPSTIDGIGSGVGNNINSKKLVLDLNSDNYILTDSKSAQQAKVDAANKAMPIKRISSPVIEPIILATQEMITRTGNPESTKGGKFKSPVPESSHSSESRDKLDMFKNIDSVLTERPAAKSITLDLESAGSSRAPSPVQPRKDSVSTVDNIAETQRKLAEVQDNIAKINDKITRKGPSEKYTSLLAQLNGKVKKYTRILNTPTRSPSSQPTDQPVPNIPPPTYKESANHVLVKSPVITPSESPKLINTEIDEELARARTLLQTPPGTIKTVPPSKKPSLTIQSSQPSQKQVVQKDKEPVTKKKERATIFDVGTSIDTLREKQTHLQEQQRKLQEEYSHKLKQIEKMKSQKAEIQKLQTLESERRKIYEMEQKLKSLEREQWKEQQALRKELHQINVRNHHPPPAIDRGELFSLKQELATRAVSGVPAQELTGRAVPTQVVNSGGILAYLYDKWSAFTKLPMGEVIHLPKKPAPSTLNYTPAHENNASVNTKPESVPPVVEASRGDPTPKNTMKYASRFIYLIDFPESEFSADTAAIPVSNESYIIPFDDAWLETYYKDICIDNECLSACIQAGANTYIQENYKTRIVTNLGLIRNNQAIEYYVTGSKPPEVALAMLAMLYSLVQFYEANQ